MRTCASEYSRWAALAHPGAFGATAALWLENWLWVPIFVLVIFLLNPWLGVFAVLAALILLGLAYVNERATGELLGDAARRASAANLYAATQLRNAAG